MTSCSECLARKSPCPRRAPMGHVLVGHRWDRMAMDILDMSVTTEKGNRCNRLRCPLARMSGLQCFNMGHNGHRINLYGVSMTLMGN